MWKRRPASSPAFRGRIKEFAAFAFAGRTAQFLLSIFPLFPALQIVKEQTR
jgi:hypothetical protein